MIHINVLTSSRSPNSRAFNSPLSSAKMFLKESGINLKFHFKVNEKILDKDILFIDSFVFKTWWLKKKENIFSFLKDAKKQGVRVFWFDTSDSTWSTQLEVLPFVDKYLKNQIFANKNIYLKSFRTGRIFTDYFDELYQSGEKETHYSIPEKSDLNKISVSWNSCFANYTKMRYNKSEYLKNFLYPLTSNLIRNKLRVSFTPPDKKRDKTLNLRVGLSHTRPSVVSHRKATAEIVRKYTNSTGKVSLSEYFNELQNSKIGLGPFGLGEITLRDYEIIICGAALMKPDLSHLQTWPDLFQPSKTFVAYRWDLTDLDAKISNLLQNDSLRTEIAENAKNVYSHALSSVGIKNFAERIIDIIN
ncbi:MAG: glycosyltransferase family 1 protein [Bacteroidetes bacterium]|nr:glycosyltransferase family 1 protein [Bacteroidota bacterium]